jgi:hypothetical protein
MVRLVKSASGEFSRAVLRWVSYIFAFVCKVMSGI